MRQASPTETRLKYDRERCIAGSIDSLLFPKEVIFKKKAEVYV